MGRLIANGRFSVALRHRRLLGPGMLEFRMQRPPGFTFLPGQFVRFVMEGYRREYTMISDPEADTIDFCIDVQRPGRFSNAIQAVAMGTRFDLIGPLGHFVFQGAANPAVFAATGTGVAPFVAYFRSGVRDALLLHGVGTADRLIYRQVLQTGVRSYVACISREGGQDTEDSVLFPGRVTHYLETRLAPGTYDFYLCGRRAMIRDAAAIIDHRFDGSRLFIEAYND